MGEATTSGRSCRWFAGRALAFEPLDCASSPWRGKWLSHAPERARLVIKDTTLRVSGMVAKLMNRHHPHHLLEAFLLTLEAVPAPRETLRFVPVGVFAGFDPQFVGELRELFGLVAAERPDLLERSLFAERSHDTVEIEKVLRATIAHLKTMAEVASSRLAASSVPDVSHLRFNHTNKRLHVGTSSRSAPFVFPRSPRVR
jgi:hypothetical protein